MLLAIDAGNTNLVFALVEDGVIRARWRIATDPRRTADQYAVWLHQLLALEGFTKADVERGHHRHGRAARAPQSRSARHQIFRRRAAGRGAGRRSNGGSRSTSPSRKSVGADRVLNAIAAHALYAGDLIVVDFGTAATFDVVDYTGAYKGGIIAPGINLSLDALVTAAASCRGSRSRRRRAISVIGRTTEEQMHIGIYWGYVAMIEGLVARMKAEIGRPVQVVATGGLATLFDAHTEFSTRSRAI